MLIIIIIIIINIIMLIIINIATLTGGGYLVHFEQAAVDVDVTVEG